MLLYLLLSAATASTPSVGDTPARTCIKTTLRANGFTNDSSVAVTSGKRDSDRYALNLVRAFNIQRERGKSYEDQTGYVLVDTYEDGGFGMSLIKYKGRLLDSCSMPSEAEDGT